MAAPLLLRGGSVLTPAGMCAGEDVRAADGCIAAISKAQSIDGADVIDARRYLVVPGFVDLHVHGAGGAMFESGTVAAAEMVSRELARHGTTAVLATLATLPPEQLRSAVESVALVAGRAPGARIVGIHLEGPFLNPRRCGAQAAAWMRPPSIVEIDELQRLCGGLIRMVTLAPELDGALELIRGLRARGIVAAVGHTTATAAQAEAAIAAGASHVTHLYNAMEPMHHRAPGVVGAALTNDAVSVELICDGHHVHPRAVELAVRCKPSEMITLVSDAVAALGLPDGPIELFGTACVIADGSVRVSADGRLAGSCVSLAQAVRNVIRWNVGLSPVEVLRAATATPARVAGLAALGTLAVGMAADVVLLEPERLGVVATIRGGEVVWSSIVAGAENCG